MIKHIRQKFHKETFDIILIIIVGLTKEVGL